MPGLSGLFPLPHGEAMEKMTIATEAVRIADAADVVSEEAAITCGATVKASAIARRAAETARLDADVAHDIATKAGEAAKAARATATAALTAA